MLNEVAGMNEQNRITSFLKEKPSFTTKDFVGMVKESEAAYSDRKAYRILQDLLRGERDALARAIATLPHERDSHACQDAEDRAADQRKRLTKEGAAKRDSSANENAGNVELYLFEKDHR